jgi:hypothetical protein
MTSELWVRIRRLLRRRTPSREVERIIAGWRAEESAHNRRSETRRERLDLIKGWVEENPERRSED